MKIGKSALAEALKVLGKVVCQTSPVAVLRSIRFLGVGEQIWLAATDGVESVVLEVTGDAEGVGDFAVEYKTLRELIRSTRGGMVEVSGMRIDWPEIEVAPADAVAVALPENFATRLAEAAPLVDRQETRQVLQGIHLCPDGIVVTDGKQLLYLPLNWYNGGYGPAEWVKKLLLDGTFYHLWYFPGVILGVLAARGLLRLGPRTALTAAGLLYLVGLGGGSY